jgi:hypothetical protein
MDDGERKYSITVALFSAPAHEFSETVNMTINIAFFINPAYQFSR